MGSIFGHPHCPWKSSDEFAHVKDKGPLNLKTGLPASDNLDGDQTKNNYCGCEWGLICFKALINSSYSRNVKYRFNS